MLLWLNKKNGGRCALSRELGSRIIQRERDKRTLKMIKSHREILFYVYLKIYI